MINILKQIKELDAHGITLREMARQLGINERLVKELLKRIK